MAAVVFAGGRDLTVPRALAPGAGESAPRGEGLGGRPGAGRGAVLAKDDVAEPVEPMLARPVRLPEAPQGRG